MEETACLGREQQRIDVLRAGRLAEERDAAGVAAEGGGIALDDGNKVIEISITAEQTEAFTKSAGVYDLELVSAGGVVTALMEGSVAIGAEVTTPIV